MEMFLRILKTHDAFRAFANDELLLLVKLCEKVKLKRGAKVFVEKQRDDCAVYFIEEGIIKIIKGSAGKETTLAMFGMGNIFGEMSFLDGQARSAAIVVDEDLVLYKLLPGKMRELEKKSPETAIKLLKVFVKKLTSRLRQTGDALVEKEVKIIIT